MARRKIEDELCIYCGDIAAVRDHVPPKKWLRLFARFNTYVTKDRVVVPACASCNGMLGALPLFTIQERRAHIRTRLWQKFRKLLEAPGWKDAELAELGPGLRRYIKGRLHQKAHIIRRIGMARW